MVSKAYDSIIWVTKSLDLTAECVLLQDLSVNFQLEK